MKKIFSSRLRVRAFGNKNDFHVRQELRKEYYLFGWKVGSLLIDSEIVPTWAVISNVCFGDTSGWKSKFYDIKEAWQK